MQYKNTQQINIQLNNLILLKKKKKFKFKKN